MAITIYREIFRLNRQQAIRRIFEISGSIGIIILACYSSAKHRGEYGLDLVFLQAFACQAVALIAFHLYDFIGHARVRDISTPSLPESVRRLEQMMAPSQKEPFVIFTVAGSFAVLIGMFLPFLEGGAGELQWSNWISGSCAVGFGLLWIYFHVRRNGEIHPKSSPSEIPQFPAVKGDSFPTPAKKGSSEEETVHIVMKWPRPGIVPNGQNTLITALVTQMTDASGKRKSNVKIYAGADPLTFIETTSALYWRNQIDEGYLADDEVVRCLLCLQRNTAHRYVIPEGRGWRTDAISIITGLTQLSLHYGIANIDRISVPQTTLDWLAREQEQGSEFDRMDDCKKADSLMAGIGSSGISEEFLSKIKKSVGFKT